MLFKNCFGTFFCVEMCCGKNVDVRGQLVGFGSPFIPRGIELGHQAGKAMPLPTELSC